MSEGFGGFLTGGFVALLVDRQQCLHGLAEDAPPDLDVAVLDVIYEDLLEEQLVEHAPHFSGGCLVSRHAVACEGEGAFKGAPDFGELELRMAEGALGLPKLSTEAFLLFDEQLQRDRSGAVGLDEA